jgi:phage terminase small subunit
MEIVTEKGGVYRQIRPEYTVMKNEYGNILKHAGKFGLNPGDRDKIFKKMKDEKQKKGFNTDGKMKVA